MIKGEELKELDTMFLRIEKILLINMERSGQINKRVEVLFDLYHEIFDELGNKTKSSIFSHKEIN